MTASIFTPIADDNLAAAHPVGTEYALVKSSGYLSFVGVGDGALDYAKHYSKARGGRKIVSRVIGTETWAEVEQVEAPESFDVPDELPEDFS